MGLIILFGLIFFISLIINIITIYKYDDINEINGSITIVSFLLLVLIIPLSIFHTNDYDKYLNLYTEYQVLISENAIYTEQQLDEIKKYNDFIKNAHKTEKNFFVNVLFDEYHDFELLDYDKAAYSYFMYKHDKEKNNG